MIHFPMINIVYSNMIYTLGASASYFTVSDVDLSSRLAFRWRYASRIYDYELLRNCLCNATVCLCIQCNPMVWQWVRASLCFAAVWCRRWYRHTLWCFGADFSWPILFTLLWRLMTTMASQITSLTIVCSTVYSGADERKHQNSASQAFVWGIHRDRWIPRTKGQ